jgi:hypothetical protein
MVALWSPLLLFEFFGEISSTPAWKRFDYQKKQKSFGIGRTQYLFQLKTTNR